MTTEALQTNLAELSQSFEGAPASEIVQWAVDRFGSRLSLLASMQDAVLIDVAHAVDPRIDVIFIDTGYHFTETLKTLEVVRRRYQAQVRAVPIATRPEPWWRSDPTACCSAPKVAAMEEALAGQLAWLSGLRRVDSPDRADSPIVSVDRRGLVKVNPLAGWSDVEIDNYIRERDVPVNPLIAQGYKSIGCAPCTRPVGPDEDPRAGRWPGSQRTECGIHT